MIKKHMKTLIITSLVIVLPMLVGAILWDQLPAQIPTHWNIEGQVDGWSSKTLAVLGLPGIMLAFQWLCVLGTLADPKKNTHPDKIFQLVLWIIPVLSLVIFTLTFLTAFNKPVQVEIILPLVMGLLFLIIGNYLPKCKQNYTIGIKLPWTLHSEENWNKTHRFAGWIWMLGGLGIMLTSFLGCFWVLIAVTAVMAFAPTVYSYILYRKGI